MKSNHKILVAYFSCSGITKGVAESIADKTGGTLYEIVPAQPYTEADLNWMDKKSRTTLEMNDEKCRPGIATKVENMSSYDVIFIGFPIWWYVAPRIINTFMESYDFDSKTIIPFCTSGGSGVGQSVNKLKQTCPKANWTEGKLLNNPSDSMLSNWISTVLP